MLVHEARQSRSQVRCVPHRAVPVPDNGLRNQGGEVLGVLPGDALDRNRNVRGRDCVVAHPHLATDKIGLGAARGADRDRIRARLQAAKVLLGQIDQFIVWDATGADENHTVGLVISGDVGGQVGLGDGEDIFLGAEDGAAERLILERSGVQVVEYDFLELLIDLFLLTQDDVALALDGGFLELGVLQDVGEDLNGFADVVLE